MSESTEKTFHVTAEDIRKLESRQSKQHGGKVPKSSDASSIVHQNKGDPTDVQANLPLPDDPPGSSDMKSADARFHTGVGSGRFSGDVARDPQRQPATQASAAREDGKIRHKETV
ncbi:hypothetical protein BZA05DRAFT_444106 [Tricharina praecox]|uniref:uncharacterized protein n=1 Tax=Tricharina praecox TaxID=43433 RepID=UPI0022211C24|nr:uncharacterized protein BZA05DRAFT_444106 [Tricharina praecox]KAI5853830.1 hypothetical protein BZA05DRAFT_444106 [Tricharina praecox]